MHNPTAFGETINDSQKQQIKGNTNNSSITAKVSNKNNIAGKNQNLIRTGV
ncbi:MAG: hypothetical protein WA421_15850 [Nitrososphaeraceae archaeon]|jgi:hypothetical protein